MNFSSLNYKIYLLLLFTFFFVGLNADPTKKTIGIYTFTVFERPQWDPESIKTGVAGSEEAAIYLSQKLAKRGYQVVVFGNPPKNSPHSNENSNPRFLPFDYAYPAKFDIAISGRMPLIATTLRQKAKKVYLWPHDTYHWLIPKSEIDNFDDVFWLSQWQREQWISVNPDFAKFNTIYGNGINLDQLTPVKERVNPYSCIYGSNYARGLSILLSIWPAIKERFPKATLDIYYGWQHWGLLTPEQENTLREEIKKLETKGVIDHGLVGHEELNKAYSNSSFWTYPCIADETFCITALKAQASGAVPVIIEGSALKETVRNGYKCANQSQYLETLIKALSESEKITLKQRKDMQNFIHDEYTWDIIADKWIKTFESPL